MFKIEDAIGDVVLISFKSSNQLEELGIKDTVGHFLITGIDRLGLWLKHPGIILSKTEDENGKPLPENKIKREKVDANFLLRWEYIISVMHYPDREGYDFPSEFDLDIGFKNKD